jgi:Cysteine protease
MTPTQKELEKVYEAEKAIGGLLPDTEDERDFNAERVGGLFGIFAYKPKQTRFVVSPQRIFNQYPLNICGWCSSTSQDEDREKTKLDLRVKVLIGLREGLISGNGFSNLRDNQKISQKFGIPEETLDQTIIPWPQYADLSLLTDEILQKALAHRCASFGQIYTKDAILETLDRGETIQTGLDWYNEYNMSGGFSAPWIIDRKGAPQNLVGGHAVKIAGYVLNYHGKDCFILQNSLGTAWGDDGYFYMPMDYALKVLYSKWVQIDLPVDIASTLNAYQFKFVKGKQGGAIYQFLGDTKISFESPSAYFSYTGDSDYHAVEDERIDNAILDAIPTSDIVKLQDTTNWKLIREMAKPDRYKEVLKAIKEEEISKK